MYKYSTALSHIILAGTGIYCLHTVGVRRLGLPQGCYGFIVANSIVGIWRYGNPSYGDDADSVYKLTSLLQDMFSLPFVVNTVWLSYGYMRELAYAHTLVAVIMFAKIVIDKENKELTDTFHALQCASLGIVSGLHENWFGVVAAMSFLFNHFMIKNEDRSFHDIPCQDLYNYAFCFFAFFALRAMFD